MALLSHKVETSDLKAGDHIYTYRAAFTYSHHGIYMGENTVIHFICNKNTCNFTSSAGLCSSILKGQREVSSDPNYCGFKVPGSGVQKSCLNCFLKNGSLYRYQYGVGRRAFAVKLRGGTCTTANFDSTEAVIHRATYLLQSGNFGNYHLLENNCEEFALYCKTGLLRRNKTSSNQVSSVKAAAVGVGAAVGAGAAVGIGAALGPAPIILVSPLLATVSYLGYKYRKDLGVRNDVDEVGVEELARKRSNDD